ncbi:proton-translocating transhydrogenase family protein [Ancylobacter sp. Lp-2]|uniref:proton-translocating transhydrogenase family protein n=1 Tax=Ancylobacter sp. Lp-2 TaxID=2881339 RepID=UPI001E4A515E|nr:proton-translocating transhydrogenase family protein [Ancylobacter sp. Lp-2]MCB4771995.1 proton-translocating transhydrogenase family protein [Ancylobacter sp. Lp-2]
MANPSGVPADPAQALEGARAAAEVAKRAAEAAQAYADAAAQAAHGGGFADAAGAVAHTLTGGAIDPFVFRLAIFVLAVFVGYYVVWSVTPALHTPLMSVTNAISSVIVVGALLAVGVDTVAEGTGWARGFGFLGLILASVNIFGGFLVTSRMLAMYSKKK